MAKKGSTFLYEIYNMLMYEYDIYTHENDPNLNDYYNHALFLLEAPQTTSRLD